MTLCFPTVSSNNILTCIIAAPWIQTGNSLMVCCVRMSNTILNCMNWWGFRRDQILLGIHGDWSIDLRNLFFRSTCLSFWDVRPFLWWVRHVGMFCKGVRGVRLYVWGVGGMGMCCKLRLIVMDISWTVMTVLYKRSVDHLTGGKFISVKIYKNIHWVTVQSL